MSRGLINVLFSRNNNENEDLEKIYSKIDGLSDDMNVLAKNMVGLSITVNTVLSEVKKELPLFADTIISELNNSIDECLSEPKSDCCCTADDCDSGDKYDYILQVYQKIGKNKHMGRVYKPNNLYFDGYNFINRIGANKGKISFTIDDVNFFNEHLSSVCETLVENNYKFSIVYNETSISKNVFPKFLFNIIEGTFNNLEPFTENPIKK